MTKSTNKNHIKIFKTIAGHYGFEASGPEFDRIGIRKRTNIANEMAMNELLIDFKASTGCSVEWLSGAPSWANGNSEDIQ